MDFFFYFLYYFVGVNLAKYAMTLLEGLDWPIGRGRRLSSVLINIKK